MSETNASERKSWEFTGWHMLVVTLGFFVVVVGVLTVMAVIAYRTFPGEVSEHPYEEGLAWNDHLKQETAQAALGWKAVADGARDASGKARIELDLTDAHGAPVAGAKINGELVRPTTSAGRAELAFAEAAPGKYIASAQAANGVWDVKFHAKRGPVDTFEGERRFTWQ